MTQTESIAEQRATAVADAMSEIRQIEDSDGINRDSLKLIREVLLSLANNRELFFRVGFSFNQRRAAPLPAFGRR